MNSRNHLTLDVTLALLLVVVNISARALFYGPLAPVSENYINYLHSLNDHFGEYVYFNALKPPITYIIHGIFANIFSIDDIINNHIILKFIIILDIIGVLFLYIVLRTLKLSPIICFFICIFYGLYIVPLEFWRQGLHYDHLSFFFNALFIFLTTRFMRKPVWQTAAAASLAGTLALAHNTVFSLIVPCALLLCLGITMLRTHTLRGWFSIGVILLALPIGGAAAISAKNQSAIGVFAPSTLGGASLMLVTMRTLERDSDALRPTLDLAEAPDWFKWCFDNYIADPKYAPISIVNSRAFGHCMPMTHSSDPTWPFDMRMLERKLGEMGANDMRDVVRQDIETMRKRRYLLYGYGPELSLRWNVIYGQEAGKVFLYDFKTHPTRYLRTFFMLAKYFRWAGPRFVVYAGTYAHIFPGGIKASTLLTVIYAMIVFYMLAIPMIFITIPISIIYFIIIFGRSYLDSRNFSPSFANSIHVIFGFCAICLTILFSTLVGEENGRYFIYAAPYYLVSVAALLSTLFHCAASRRGTEARNDFRA